jgi:cytochrome c biogenesis protein
MFSSPVFLGLLALLATSLMACTYTTQLPMVKIARRYGHPLVYATSWYADQ